MNLPVDIVDPHIHQWDPFTTPRVVSREARLVRRIRRIPRGLRRALPRADREFVGDPHHVLKPYLPADYLADTGQAQVSSVVHVEASWVGEGLASVDETRWVTSLPFGQEGAPQLGAVVVHVDPREPTAAAVLDAHLAASPLVRGVRISAAHHPDPGVRDFADEPHLLSDPSFVRGFAAVAERSLSFELWLYSHQLPDALALVREYPETTFVLDHYATPAGVIGPRGKHTGRTAAERADILSRWRDDVAALGERGNVVAKHSGLGMPVLGADPDAPYDAADVDRVAETYAPLVRHLHRVFGSDRAMWASNYPMDKPVMTIPTSASIVATVLGSDAGPRQSRPIGRVACGFGEC